MKRDHIHRLFIAFILLLVGLTGSCGLELPTSLSNTNNDLARLSGLWYYESPGSSILQFEERTEGDVDINGNPVTLPESTVFRNYIEFSGTTRFAYWSEAYNNAYGLNPLLLGGLNGGDSGVIYGLNQGSYLYNTDTSIIEAYYDSVTDLSGSGPNITIPVFDSEIYCGLPNNGLFFDDVEIQGDTFTFIDRAHKDSDCNSAGETVTAHKISGDFSADLVYPDAVRVVISGDAFGEFENSQILAILMIVDETFSSEPVLFGFAGDAVEDNEYNVEFYIPATYFGGQTLYMGGIIAAETGEWEFGSGDGDGDGDGDGGPQSDGVAITFGDVDTYFCSFGDINNFAAVNPDDQEVIIPAQDVIAAGNVIDLFGDPDGSVTCD